MARQNIPLVMLGLLITACAPQVRLADPPAVVSVFIGELPGTHCDRAHVRLVLHQTGQAFTLTETAVGDLHCPARATEGTWILRQGNDLDTTARYYELRAIDGQVYRLAVVGNDLMLADDGGNPLWLPFDGRLKNASPNENDLH